MSATIPQKPVLIPGTRATTFDYYLLLVGAAISFFLLAITNDPPEFEEDPPNPMIRHLGHVRVEPGKNAKNETLQRLVLALPDAMRLHEGILLLFPLFYMVQLIFGRPVGLSTVECLWLLAWFGTIAINAFGAWKQFGEVPDMLQKFSTWPAVIWYAIFTPALSLVNVGCWVYSLTTQKPYPWTHKMGTALLLWPVPWGIAWLVLGAFSK